MVVLSALLLLPRVFVALPLRLPVARDNGVPRESGEGNVGALMAVVLAVVVVLTPLVARVAAAVAVQLSKVPVRGPLVALAPRLGTLLPRE